MGIPVKLAVYEGPLDLLLHLIDKNKLNIYDIPIVEITNQYLEYIKQMEKNNMDVMSEFIEMAATLISIKSKMLLPAKVEEEESEVDPRAELVEKLLEYKKYKYISNKLKLRQIDAEKIAFKEPSIPKEILNFKPKIQAEDVLKNVELDLLYEIFNSVIKKQKDKVDPIRSKFGEIKKEEFTVQEKIDYINDLSLKYNSISFTDLLESGSSKVEVIVSFLAVLELIKMGAIIIKQEEIYKDIIIIFIK